MIIWLLLAATLAVDAVAIYGLYQNPMAPNAGVLFESLCFSQLSIVAIWSVFTTRRMAVAAVALACAIGVAAATYGWLQDIHPLEMLAFFGTNVTLIVILLWIFKHTKWWQRAIPRPAQTWQFSVGHLLVLMTVVAVLITLFRRGDVLQTIQFAVASDIVTNCCLALATALIWTTIARTPIRLILLVVVAALVGLAGWASTEWFAALTNPADNNLLRSVAGSLIQVILLVAWTELGGIIPRTADSEATGATSP